MTTQRQRVRAELVLLGPDFMDVVKVFDRCTTDEATDLLTAMLFAFDSYGGDGMVRLPEVMKMSGLGRATIYRKMAGGSFPKGVPLAGTEGRPTLGWEMWAVRKWLRGRAQIK